MEPEVLEFAVSVLDALAGAPGDAAASPAPLRLMSIGDTVELIIHATCSRVFAPARDTASSMTCAWPSGVGEEFTSIDAFQRPMLSTRGVVDSSSSARRAASRLTLAPALPGITHAVAETSTSF